MKKSLDRLKNRYNVQAFITRWNEVPTERERYWVNMFLWIIVLAFFCGYFVSANHYSKVSNEKTQEVIDAIVEQYSGRCAGYENPAAPLQALLDEWNISFKDYEVIED